MLRSFIDKEGGAPAPANLDVFREIDAVTPGATVKVKPGVNVVRLGRYDDGSAGWAGTGSQILLFRRRVLLLAWRRTIANINDRGLVCERGSYPSFFFSLFLDLIRFVVFIQNAERGAKA